MSQASDTYAALSPSLPKLRPYQLRFISEVYAYIRAGKRRILGFSPTGSGKTVIASQIISHAISRQRRVLFVVHREILISQTAEKFQNFNVNDCGFIKSGWPENRESLIQIASVQTLSKRNWWQQDPADLVILDEAHIVSYSQVVQLMMRSTYPKAIYLGITATPWRRSKHEGMGDIFDSVVCAPMPFELINQGFLVKPSYFSLSQADLEKVGTVNGDFDEGQLAIACDRPELIQQIVQDWKRYAWGRRTIIFAVNVQHSKNLALAFLAEGVTASHVDGTTPLQTANQIYQQLAAGQILVLSSCMKLTEGFDEGSISAVVLCRPTLSKALHFQMLGRGLRLSPETNKTDCVFIDQAGNVQRHGFVEDLKEVSLARGQEKQEAESPKKICPVNDGGCGAILYASQVRCNNCGYLFPKQKKFYFVPELQQQLCSEDFERYEFCRQKIREAYQRNFAPGWAALVFKEKYGHWPPDTWARGAVFGLSATVEQRDSYYSYLQVIAQRKEKPESWIEHYMYLELGFT